MILIMCEWDAAGQPVEAEPLLKAPWPQLYQQQELDGRPALQPVTHTLLLNLPEHRLRMGALTPAQDKQARLIQVGATMSWAWRNPPAAVDCQCLL